MSKTLRELLTEAASDLDTYKHPDIDEARERLNEVLAAAGLGSTGGDRITSIQESAGFGGHFEIRTAYSVRSCAMDDEFRLPVHIVDAADPVKAAAEWKEAEALAALRDTFNKAHRAAEQAAHALFAALPVGPERARMSQVYENVRTATRVPL